MRPDLHTTTPEGAAGHASQFTRGYDDAPETLGAEDVCPHCRQFTCPITCRRYEPPQVSPEAARWLREAREKAERIDREWAQNQDRIAAVRRREGWGKR